MAVQDAESDCCLCEKPLLKTNIVCSRCKQVFYCNDKCRKADAGAHKKTCASGGSAYPMRRVFASQKFFTLVVNRAILAWKQNGKKRGFCYGLQNVQMIHCEDDFSFHWVDVTDPTFAGMAREFGATHRLPSLLLETCFGPEEEFVLFIFFITKGDDKLGIYMIPPRHLREH